MPDLPQPSTHNPGEAAPVRPTDPAARRAGMLLIATALATAVAVAGRVAADADQATLAESMRAISDSAVLYGTGGVARLISGLTLLAAAWLLSRTWIIRERFGTPLVPALFATSGAFTVISGACATALAASAIAMADAATLTTPGASIETADLLRWLTGKIGFAGAGLALIVASLYQWKAGGALRRISPFSAVIGVAMQLIWIDSATIMHPINGTAFFVWLGVVGAMLATGRVERRFALTSNLKSTGLRQ